MKSIFTILLSILIAATSPIGAWAQEKTACQYAMVDTEAGCVTIDGTLGGKTEATEKDLATMVELLKSYIENGHTTIIVTGSQPAKLLASGYLTPVVSLAFEQLTYAYQNEKNDSYWGTVDLIYQDVTEIVEYEFYCCDVLKSITLPKVTTVGDRGFWACYYLETLTFGSVVTAINDNSGEVFYDLGYKIDGCNLVLNCGQLQTASKYQPNLKNNTWWSIGNNTEWKNITLTHDDSKHTIGTDNGDGTHSFECTVCGTTDTESHSVGTASCDLPAYCLHCGAIYGEETTGMNEIKYKRAEDKKIYDLQGRKVDAPTRGIYIIDDKKVILK